MAAILCLDFDDTIVLDNSSRQVFERFAADGWRDLEAAYHRGELTVEQYNAAAFATVEATAEEIVAFVRTVARPRPGLPQLNAWAARNGWLVSVVSNGLDLCVDPVLDDLGLDRVARHCGRTTRGYRWRVSYFSPRGVELQQGFKLAYASAHHQAGDFVAYMGDGASDVGAARLAGAVFARDTLWRELKDEHPRIYAFETFHDVIAVLEREAGAWLAAPAIRD
ncbi:MAG: HAD-IB family phosphatase [Chloroflexi bacterium]|nr:HAD-IB family phosphatase [Chloroflexota bacterium]